MPPSVKQAKANNPKDKVRELQRSLWMRAKQSRTRRFHALYDRIYRRDVLCEAWKRVRRNGGAAGVDEKTLADIEREGVAEFLESIQAALKAGKYRPSPVKRRYIPKADGKQRPLGIPTVRDRVVQMAAKLVVEPIFEADFKPCSYGFRPKKSATQALEAIRKAGNYGYNFVLEADIRAYYDSIDQSKLMEMLAERITDRRVQKLIRQWLKAGVLEGGTVKESLAGTPQGGVISPLLANIYLNSVDHAWERERNQLGVLVRYADDFVVMCKTESQAKEALRWVTKQMAQLGLTLHPDKTRIVSEAEGFDFLGYRFERGHHWPRKKSLTKFRDGIRVLTRRANGKSLDEIIAKLNSKLRGWYGYFKHSCKSTLTKQDGWIRRRLRTILNKREGRSRWKVTKRDHQRWPNAYFHAQGLFSLTAAHATECQSLYDRATINWRAGCGKSASPVRREG